LGRTLYASHDARAKWAEAVLRCKKAGCLRRARKFTEALNELQKAEELFPAYKDALLERGYNLLDINQPTEALLTFEQVLRLELGDNKQATHTIDVDIGDLILRSTYFLSAYRYHHQPAIHFRASADKKRMELVEERLKEERERERLALGGTSEASKGNKKEEKGGGEEVASLEGLTNHYTVS
jgi:tetratricopeptide (TPR) repeat protein